MKRFAAICTGIIAALCTACVGDGEPEISDRDSRLKTGDTAPAFTVTLSDNTTFSSPADFTESDSTLIVFFNTTCPDCREELENLQQRQQATHAPRIICISRAQGREEILKYWEEHSLTLVYAAVPDRSVYSLFALRGIPRSYLFSPSGRLIRQTAE